MELKDIDLNLLVVFNQLLAERKVSKVAENLGLGQPAVSNALARLRKLFDDELFTRTASGMQPTPFAEQLAESVGYALGMIHGAVNARNTFDPRTSKRGFTVGMTDIGEIYFLPQLMQRIEEIAPSVSISTVRNTATNLKDAMESGQVDLAVGLLPQLRRAFSAPPVRAELRLHVSQGPSAGPEKDPPAGLLRCGPCGRRVCWHGPWAGGRDTGQPLAAAAGETQSAPLRRRGPHLAVHRSDGHGARAAGRAHGRPL